MFVRDGQSLAIPDHVLMIATAAERALKAETLKTPY
jgi:hypothetical protein